MNPIGTGSSIDAWVAVNEPQLIAWRRDMHQHPELSRVEHRTTDLVVAELESFGFNPVRMPLGSGVLCDVGPATGERIGLRADMDALPIPEHTGLPFASVVAGVSHACGHDAHTAILLGVAKYLAENDNLSVGVRLIFQPAEEVMAGALDAVAAGATAGLSSIYALHCDPKLEVGRVGLRKGAITSAADVVEISLRSPGGHTSRPHLTSDLVYGMGTVITGLPGLLSRRIDPSTSTVMVWGSAHAGEAFNVIPQEGVLRGTVRTGDHGTWVLLEPTVRDIIAGLLAPLGIEYDLMYKRGVPPVVNDPECYEKFHDAVVAIGPNAIADTPQSGGGEDFSWYLEDVPGVMGRLGVWSGSGDQFDIHQPNFVLDERALAVGVKTFLRLAVADR